MSRGERSSRSQIRKRVADIYGLVVDGVPHAQIFRFVAANCSWQASERTIESYIARAREQMREDAQVERREVFAESLARKQRLSAREHGQPVEDGTRRADSIDRMFGDFAGERDELSDVAASWRRCSGSHPRSGASQAAKLREKDMPTGCCPVAVAGGLLYLARRLREARGSAR